jgi:hypothetical protein
VLLILFAISVVSGIVLISDSERPIVGAVVTFAVSVAAALGASSIVLEVGGYSLERRSPYRWIAAGAYGFMVVSWTLAALVIAASIVY